MAIGRVSSHRNAVRTTPCTRASPLDHASLLVRCVEAEHTDRSRPVRRRSENIVTPKCIVPTH